MSLVVTAIDDDADDDWVLIHPDRAILAHADQAALRKACSTCGIRHHECALKPRTMVMQYKYEMNGEHMGEPHLLWGKESERKVSFRSRWAGISTDWRGIWEYSLEDDDLFVQFDCRGVATHKWTLVIGESGFDYRNRAIRMIQMLRWDFDDETAAYVLDTRTRVH